MANQEVYEGLEVYHGDSGLQVYDHDGLQPSPVHDGLEVSPDKGFRSSDGSTPAEPLGIDSEGPIPHHKEDTIVDTEEISTEKTPKGRGRKFWIIVGVVCLIIAAAAIGGGVGGSRKTASESGL